ncbi:MAG: NYN domain-containing protein [Armatimonadota bacterium]
MTKVMIFIDGTWLYSNTPKLCEAYGQEDYHVDFRKLPVVLADKVKSQLGATSIDIVRTYLFGSYAQNYDLRDDDSVQRRRDFFSMLKEEYHYEVEIFPVNYFRRRIRKSDRDPNDSFDPKEKCVDISLATSMLYFAAIPYAYDIAIAVIGDQDFKPVLQHVRRLGKRVAIASVKGSCSPEYADPRDEARVKDFNIIWIDDLLTELELKYERHKIPCESPYHKGPKEVWTYFHPRRGQKFFCDECRQEFLKQKREAQCNFLDSEIKNPEPGIHINGHTLRHPISGVVAKRLPDKGYGFIETADGNNYFFHLTDLESDIEFDDAIEGTPVVFEIKQMPSAGKAGAAQNVRRHSRIADPSLS